MKTTIKLDDKLVRQVLALSKAKTKTAAVTMALEEYVRREKIKKLRSLLGQVKMDFSDLTTLREMEKSEA